MKKILFLLNNMPDKARLAGFRLKMRLSGIAVSYKPAADLSALSDDTLYVTDSSGVYGAVRALHSDALIYIKSPSDADNFPDAKYFIMDAESTEPEYFENVYKRIHNIPWEPVKTKRLILRETTEADVDDFFVMYKDPRMTEFMENLYEDIEDEKKYAREYREKVYATQGFGIWTVVRKSDMKVIGRAGLTAREGFDEYELGFAIGCDYQRSGYGFEAVTGVLDFARKNRLGNIIAMVMSGNTASKALLKKAGFESYSETCINGIEYDVYRREEQ